MVNLTINNRRLSVPEGTTIMAAAASIGMNYDSTSVLAPRY